MGFLQKLFGTHSQHELKRIYPIVDAIEALDSDMQKLSDAELKDKTREFKERLANGETLDDILPEAYAVVREAAWRVLGMKHYRVQLIGGIIPIVYFARKNDSLLRLGKTRFDGKVLGKVCLNGVSELMTNISLSLVGIIYNAQLMRIVGVDGVSAYGVLQYIGFIFIAVFLGYSVGSAPIIGYHFGAQNHAELKNIFKKSLWIVEIFGLVMTAIAIIFAKPLASIFVGYDKALLEMTANGIRLNAFSYLTCGLNIFTSAFFTALGSGGLSLLVSFSRTFLCQVICVLTLPIWWGLNGVWTALVVAESVTLLLSVFLLILSRQRFHYA